METNQRCPLKYYPESLRAFYCFAAASVPCRYRCNNIDDVHYNAPCAAIDWMPVWLQKEGMISSKIIAEYACHSLNIGAIVSLWRNHFDVMVELQSMKWITVGIRYKLVLKS